MFVSMFAGRNFQGKVSTYRACVNKKAHGTRIFLCNKEKIQVGKKFLDKLSTLIYNLSCVTARGYTYAHLRVSGTQTQIKTAKKEENNADI